MILKKYLDYYFIVSKIIKKNGLYTIHVPNSCFWVINFMTFVSFQ